MNDSARDSLDSLRVDNLPSKRKSPGVEQDPSSLSSSLCLASEQISPHLAQSTTWNVPLPRNTCDWEHTATVSELRWPASVYLPELENITPRPKRPRRESDISSSESLPRPSSLKSSLKTISIAKHRRSLPNHRPQAYLRAAREKLKSSGLQSSCQIRYGPPSVARCSPLGPGPSEGSLMRTLAVNLEPEAGRLQSLHYVEQTHPCIPTVYPPINRDTLKELDLEAILKNPQLRHDLLFEPSLKFRATTSRRKREMTNSYWLAVKRELENGRTCISFDKAFHSYPQEYVCSHDEMPPILHPRVLATSGSTSSESNRVWTIRMPSRIHPLIIELLEVILCVLFPPSRMSAPGIQWAMPRRPSPELLAQAQWLRAALDPVLIVQELKHGLFEPSSLFTGIGEILKCHCAPMRDAAIQTMVEVAQTCAPGRGGGLDEALRAIRMCFELLELMKLDVANHQLTTIRSYLFKSAPEFDVRVFQERHDRGDFSISTTDSWLRSAHAKLLASPDSLPELTPLNPYLTPAALQMHHRLQQIQFSVLIGMTDLIFSPPVSPPVHLPSFPTTTPANRSLPHLVPLPHYPETLYLDHSRILIMTADAADLTATFMLLMLYRQLVFKLPAPNGRRVIEGTDIERVKKEIWAVGPTRLGLCFCEGHELGGSTTTPQTSESNQSGTAPTPQEQQADLEQWRDSMRDAILQITLRAEHTRVAMSSVNENGAGRAANLVTAPSADMLELANRWCDSHLRSGAPLAALFRKKLRTAVLGVVFSAYASLRGVPGSSLPADAGSRRGVAGMEPLATEIRHLGERIAKLAALHLRVYLPFYERTKLPV